LGQSLFKKSLTQHHFESDREKILQERSSSKYASIDSIRFSISRQSFKMVAMTSFYATKCCNLVSEHELAASTYAAASVSS